MSFRFPFESLLHFRQSVEHQQELRLRAANQQVARVRHLLDQLDGRLVELHRHQSQQLTTGTTGAELSFASVCKSELFRQQKLVYREMIRLEKLRDEQQKIFDHARREREVFESLRDHQLHDYQRNAKRRDQQHLDDLFLLRQAYLRRG